MTMQILFSMLAVTAAVVHAGPVPLKPGEMSLNGTWSLTIGDETHETQIPEHGINRIGHTNRLYRREIAIPQDWSDQRVQLEFEVVNFVADVSLRRLPDGQPVPVGTHVGGWVPFAFDLTGLVSAGERYELIVRVEGMHSPHIRRSDWFENHPIGNQQFVHGFDGIVDGVWLRAYGAPVHVVDAFISPTLRAGRRLRVRYDLHNTSDTRQEVIVRAVAKPWGDLGLQAPEKRFEDVVAILQPGEVKQITADHAWPDAELWWPDAPFLYTLTTRIVQHGETIDEETRRFGFREFLVNGKAFTLNGVPTRLRGDYLGFPGSYYMDESRLMPDRLAETYRYLKREYHFNAIRWHQRPAPRFCFDVADEVGILIVCESAVYGRPAQDGNGRPLGPMPDDVRANYIQNSRRHLAAWTRARRNHPSIVLFSPVNEMGPKYVNHQRLTFDEIDTCLQVTRDLADDRPIVSHGNNFWISRQTLQRQAQAWSDWPTPGTKWQLGFQQHGTEDVISFHYPGNPPLNDSARNENGKPWILTWDYLVNASTKPVGFGEYFQTAGFDRPGHQNHEAAQWLTRWFGLWNRGLRYLDVADYRPKLVFWTERIDTDLWRKRNVVLSNAPVALFDRDYDEEGIRYWTSNFRMSHTTGAPESRRLWLFNDDLRGERVTIEVTMLVAGTEVASARKELDQPLGTHGEQTLHLVAPDRLFQLRRRVLKEGNEVFCDTMEYQVVGAPDDRRPRPPGVSWEPIE